MQNQIVNVSGIEIPTAAMSEIIHKAGEIMLSAVSHEVYKEKEGASNFVTEYDVKVQQIPVC